MAVYSRRLKVEEKENRRKAYGFALLTLACIAFMIYFGIPLLARVSNFTYDLRKSGEPIESSDKTPPPPPSFSELPSFTNKDRLDINGNTEPGVTVVIFLNDKRDEVVADSGGSFSKSLPLNNGENSIYAYAQDSAGNKSHETSAFSITFDNQDPDLEVGSPKDGDMFYGQKQKQLPISGKTESGAQVYVNDRFVIMNSDGTFSYTYGLNDGENVLTVKAEDKAGNTTEETITVKFTS